MLTARGLKRRLIARMEEKAERAQNCEAELTRLRTQVEQYGLRATARTMGVDPSNLRRRLLTIRACVVGSTEYQVGE